MKLSDAQFAVLHQLREFGPINTHEIYGPVGMDGKRKAKLETGMLTAATLGKLCEMGLVAVSRGEAFRPANAVGARGNKRVPICISITADGLGHI